MNVFFGSIFRSELKIYFFITFFLYKFDQNYNRVKRRIYSKGIEKYSFLARFLYFEIHFANVNRNMLITSLNSTRFKYFHVIFDF